MDKTDPVWRIEMLGGLRAHRGGQVLERFQTRKTEALLAYLACYPQQAHQREALITILWPEAEPEAGRNRLSQAITWLRTRLEPGSVLRNSVLLADRYSLSLVRGAISTDVSDFEAALQTAKGTRNTEAKIAALQRSATLYQGDFLSGQYDDWIVAESQRLREQFLEALRLLAVCLEQAQNSDDAIAALRRLIAVEPSAVESQGQLIRLLLKQGQADVARRQLRELERVLDREVGQTPPPWVQTLFNEVSKVSAVVTSPEMRSDAAPKHAPALPVSLTKFFGREAEIYQIERLLQQKSVRLVTLLGIGGTGKTRLAMEVARRVAESFGNAVWFAPLADLAEAHAIPNLLVDVLRLPRSSTPLESVMEALSVRPSLLVLDNLEHLAEESAPLVRDLLERSPLVTILVTSRQRLGLDGEHEIMVPPLPVPTSAVGTVRALRTPETLRHLESVSLFVDRAQLVRADFTLRDENADAIAFLCERLDGIPLALELCAAWAQMLTPAQMLTQLTRRFDLLVSRRKDIPMRHRTLRAALEYSYLLLPSGLQQLFTGLSVFRGGWSLNAAAFVCLGDETKTPEQIPLASLGQLAELRERSLILAEDNSEYEMRYRMLETLREFAAEQQTLAIEEPLRHRHAEYFLQLAEEAASYSNGSEQMLWRARLETENDNLRAALAWCLETQSVETGLMLGTALTSYWYAQGFLGEGQEWLERLLALRGSHAEETLPIRVRALNSKARLARGRGEFATAETAVQEALIISRRLKSLSDTATSLQILATLAYSRENYDDARSALEEALILSRRIENQALVAGALTNLGNVAMELCEWPQARSLYSEALELHRQEQDQKRVADVLNNLGLVARYQGDYETALRYLEEDLGISRELTNPSSTAIALLNLGTVHRLQGDFAQAHQLLKESAILSSEVENKRALAWCIKELGHLACAEKDYVFGIRLLAASENLRQILGMSFKPADPEALEQDKGRAQAALGQDNFAVAWQGGRDLSFAEAYHESLKEPENLRVC